MSFIAPVNFLEHNASHLFQQSILDTGFAVISHHPIQKELIDKAYTEWKQFFASKQKHTYTFDPKVQAGYFPFLSENAKDSPKKDLKEFYHYYPWWDQNPTQQLQASITLRNQMNDLAGTLLNWIESQTPMEVQQRFSQSLSSMIKDCPSTLFRAIHYPPLSGEEEEGAVRAAAHEDINLITLLPAATQMGLEVLDLKGNWHQVPCDYGMIVVNAGDMLKEASGGFYPSTTHRVMNPSGEEAKKSRLSMPLFLHPKGEVRLSQRFTAQEYLDQRLTELGLKQ